MEVNWVTVAAQIVNFLILVALLKKFLYQPVLAAMRRRQQLITEQIESAERREHQARQARDNYQALQDKLKAGTDALRARAKKQVEAERRKLMSNMREELSRQRQQWHQELAAEQEDFVQEFKQQAGKLFIRFSRRALKDLGNSTLEKQLIDRFLQCLRSRDKAELAPLHSAAGRPRIVTGFAIDSEAEAYLQQQLTPIVGAGDIEFQYSPELFCGIELNVGDRRISWSLAKYLRDMEHNLSTLLQTGNPARQVEPEKSGAALP